MSKILELRSVHKPILSRKELVALIASSMTMGSIPIFCQLTLFAPIHCYFWACLNQTTKLVTGMLLFIGIAYAFGSLFALLFKSSRRYAQKALLISLCFVIFLFSGLKARSALRMKQFEDLVDRSKPLIAAISLFEKDHGRPPAKLELLVPKYISGVPHTGLGAYPDYEYSTPGTSLGQEASWELSVDCPVGFFKFDAFYYLPTEKYPEDVFGGYLEPIKSWAYFHD